MPMLRKVMLAALILAMASATVMACDCADKSDAESFAMADVVFIGNVIRVEGYTTTFKVTEWLKGSAREHVVILGGSDCDKSFFENQTYIVYAFERNGELAAGYCMANRVIYRPSHAGNAYLSVLDADLGDRSYGEIAAITATCVFLSLGLGVLVSATKRRFRK
jgi:hypothetical protein